MRLVVCLALAACSEPRPPVVSPQPRTDPRQFCAALVRGDLAAASAAAASQLASTGVRVKGHTDRATELLRRWIDAQPCVARAELERCNARLISVDLQSWTKRRPALRAKLDGDGGRVKLVDRTHLDPACRMRFLE